MLSATGLPWVKIKVKGKLFLSFVLIIIFSLPLVPKVLLVLLQQNSHFSHVKEKQYPDASTGSLAYSQFTDYLKNCFKLISVST